MPRPFISYTNQRIELVAWLRELLVALGFEEPIVVNGMDLRRPTQKVLEELNKADCLFALVSPENPRDPVDATRPAPWIRDELAIATSRNLPIGAICEPRIQMAGLIKSDFTWQTVDMEDDSALLKAIPLIVSGALRIKHFLDQKLDREFPFTFERVQIRNQLFQDSWEQLRHFKLQARQRISSTDHSVDTGLDKTAGLSVKIQNPSTDLKVSSKQRPNLRIEVTNNSDREVAYKVQFDPPLLLGEQVEYRHESRHPNIFPMTSAQVQTRAKSPGAPPFMADGFVGDAFDVMRPINELVLEMITPINSGFSSPEVTVYITGTSDRVEEESKRIGNPNTARHLWQVNEDPMAETWSCRVKIPNPGMGLTYCLLARPTS